ncbi:hypothetical protein [Dyadobacter sp. CY323]|uniref:hypothetical protein n=1 Tax=Dyadobacter sp. CY323 TaxID=2907302 RepID=UPI001F2DACCE|nr:hypothetical protein [Dyadobacter sp. CY323]MCE6987973.1 hypothetical protein [Dyadobacter sp. CY323]
MEKNHHILKKAISKLPDYEPGEELWSALNENLAEQPLKAAVKELPEYEPDALLWEIISRKTIKKPTFTWWYAAAMVVAGLSLGLLIYKNDAQQQVSYSIEKVDSRLQNEGGQVTDTQYQRLKAYCEMETLVCNSKDYRRLQEEYEKLDDASVQLRQAIGEYNTEVELIRQVTILEEQKADVLNEMAKMI